MIIDCWQGQSDQKQVLRGKKSNFNIFMNSESYLELEGRVLNKRRKLVSQPKMTKTGRNLHIRDMP